VGNEFPGLLVAREIILLLGREWSKVETGKAEREDGKEMTERE
jgi:hypothetical protein